MNEHKDFKIKNYLSSRHSWWILVLLVFLFFNILSYRFIFHRIKSPPTIVKTATIPFVKDALDRDIYPFWTPYIFSGMPAFPAMLTHPRINPVDYYMKKASALIPINSDNPEYLLILANLLLLAVSVFYVLRSWGSSVSGAFLAGLVGVFVPQFIAWYSTGQYSTLLALSLIPLILLLAQKLIIKQNALYFSLLSLVLGVQLFRDLQISLITWLVLLLFFVSEIIRNRTLIHKVRLYIYGSTFGLAALLFALALTAVLYLPVLEYTKFATRLPFMDQVVPISLAETFSAVKLIGLVVPSFFHSAKELVAGDQFIMPYPVYFGVIILFLAGLSLFISKNNKIWVMGVIFILPFLLVLTKNVLNFNQFLVPAFILSDKIFILSAFAIVFLAGFGLDALSQLKSGSIKYKRVKVYTIFFTICLAFITLILLFKKSFFIEAIGSGQGLSVTKKEQIFSLILFDSIKSMILVLLAFGIIHLKRFRMILLVILALFDVLLINFRMLDSVPVLKKESFFRETRDVAVLKQDDDIFRIFPIQERLENNWYMYNRIQSITGYSSSELEIYRDFLDETGYMQNPNPFLNKYWRYAMHEDKAQWLPIPLYQIPANRLEFDYAMLDMLNVKYLITDNLTLNDPRFKPILENDRIVYENTTVLPRVFFADSVEILKGRQQIFKRMKNGSFDPRNTAILEENPPFQIKPADSTNQAWITFYDIQQINIEVNTNEPSLLVLSEIFYPSGWKAFIDGVETKIYKTNYILRSIFLEPGNHKIVFVYRSSVFKIGMWTSIISASVLILLLLLSGYIHFKNTNKDF